MPDSSDSIKVKFAPGAFDNFEGSQEELDEFQQELIDRFEGMTMDEFMEMSEPVSQHGNKALFRINLDELASEFPDLAEELRHFDCVQDLPVNTRH